MRIDWKLSFLLTLAFMAGGVMIGGAINHFFPPPVECHPAIVMMEPHSPEPLMVEVEVCATDFRVRFHDPAL